MPKRRLSHVLVALSFVCISTSLFSACSKPEPPPPGPLASDEDEKKTKKKKKSGDEGDDPKPIGGPDEASSAGDAAAPKIVGPAGSGKSKSDSDKAKLIACCTALRNAAAAAGIANAAGSAVIPGMPTPPPKTEIDKQVAECDKQVANWTGDLNTSLGKVKGAAPVSVPSACML